RNCMFPLENLILKECPYATRTLREGPRPGLISHRRPGPPPGPGRAGAAGFHRSADPRGDGCGLLRADRDPRIHADVDRSDERLLRRFPGAWLELHFLRREDRIGRLRAREQSPG